MASNAASWQMEAISAPEQPSVCRRNPVSLDWNSQPGRIQTTHHHRKLAGIDGIFNSHFLRSYVEDFSTSFDVRRADIKDAVQSAGAQQSGVLEIEMNVNGMVILS
jgi:hypothetical protein